MQSASTTSTIARLSREWMNMSRRMQYGSNSRRDFLKCGMGLSACALASPLRAAVENTEPMKITRIDAVTFRKDLHIGGGSGNSEDGAEFWWVQLHTDRGITG